MYTWGAPSGIFQGSPLGLGDGRRRVRPTLVSSFVRAREHVENVACGPSWTLCSTRSNRVYASGSSDFGVTGRGATGSSSVFQEIEFFHSVLRPSAPSSLAASSASLSAAFPSFPHPASAAVPPPGVHTPGRLARDGAEAHAASEMSSAAAAGSTFSSPAFASFGASAQGLTAAEMQAQLVGHLPAHLRERLSECGSGDGTPPHARKNAHPQVFVPSPRVPTRKEAVESAHPSVAMGKRADAVPFPQRGHDARDLRGARTPESDRASQTSGTPSASFRGRRREDGSAAEGTVALCREPREVDKKLASFSGVAQQDERARRGLPCRKPLEASAEESRHAEAGETRTRGDSDPLYRGELQSKTHTKVRHMSCGAWHSLLATDDGRLWAWGRNEDGQLGREVEATAMTGASVSFSPYPVLIHALLRGGARAVQVAGGSSQSFALAEDGALHAWGGSWGRQPVAMALHPRFDKSPIKGKVTKLAAGWEERAGEDYAVAVTDAGDLYVWGCAPAASFRAAQAVPSVLGAEKKSEESAHAEEELQGRRDKDPVKIDRRKLFGGGAVRDVACGPLGILVLVEH
ncbi:conserved hypothetical protein [Neospora caninum Liverpool]|nr:conserved hypothetical protein [Neospora caninum Liverpool]CBZ54622.1 conserved hypothetical protein [Neospora caninum Liverpool]|eukprot:XP_003884652.1 conserved hypothetical protein [Neospora caninum Liverpool]